LHPPAKNPVGAHGLTDKYRYLLDLFRFCSKCRFSWAYFCAPYSRPNGNLGNTGACRHYVSHTWWRSGLSRPILFRDWEDSHWII